MVDSILRCYIHVQGFKVTGLSVLEKNFLKGCTIYGRGGHLGYVTQSPRKNFHSPIPLRLHMKFVFDSPSGLEKKIFENGGRRTDNGPWLY